jgi:glucuronosyltransferase
MLKTDIDTKIIFFFFFVNKSAREKVKRLSLVMRDEILPGGEMAAYWIEYVIRHGGTKHLQLAAKDMPFYKRYLIDVTLFIVSTAVIFLFIAYKLIRLLLRCCWKQKTVKIKTN